MRKFQERNYQMKMYKLYCSECKSECEIGHEMTESYQLLHCPFCGAETDSDMIEELEYDDGDILQTERTPKKGNKAC